uniref:Putative vitronectin receptor alpha subunit n=1 Tax=Corethrella appendiculata TaxID=1370023 RepID=U5EVI2_9DIPT
MKEKFVIITSNFSIFLLFLLLLLDDRRQSVNCFNLENRLPIYKTGQQGSYFGYSIAAHVEKKYDQSEQKWILVGAPLGQNLQPNTTKSGALFKCPIQQNPNDCQQVITDGRRSWDESDDRAPLMEPIWKEEMKDGQWLGVTLSSQGAGGKVLVCAHRYVIKTKDLRLGQGLCYVLHNDLTYEETYQPCKGRTISREHEDYAYCQAGTSGTILEDGTAIIGTPGPYTWRGTVFVISVGGEYLERDKNHYYGPHEDNDREAADKYSYLGMAVTGGKYFGNHMSYASGAPRSAGHGQVFIFSKHSHSQKNPILVSKRIDGEQFGSSFGYELTTADVNADDLPDLIVAAPFYFGRASGGAVYVYQNKDFDLPDTPTNKLMGKLESRFGLALANMGDINKDGCDDIAIGAPYEDDGVVYIYLGSKNGLSNEPSQIIRSSDLGLRTKPIKTFGSSLSGGIDLDDNTYPDLLIGAHDSSTVTVLLARPITNIKTEVISTELQHIDPTVTGCSVDPNANLTCFTFKACCSIDPYGDAIPSKTLDLIYTIEAETYNGLKKFSRVFFGRDMSKRSNVVRQKISVRPNGSMECRQEIVYIKDNTRDIQSPIKFRLNYTIVEPPLPDSGLKLLNPILDQTQADRQFVASFQKDCGNDDICESLLNVQAELTLEQESDRQYTLILGQNDEIQLNISVTNQADSAYESHLYVEHPSNVAYIAASKGSVICNRFNSTIVECSLGNPMRRNSVSHVTLRFDPSGLEGSDARLSFDIFANTTSNLIDFNKSRVNLKTKIIKKAELSISGRARPEQTFYGGEVKGETAMETMDDVGTTVQHTYQIYNDGPSLAPYLEVYILWPHQVANDKEQGKWLLYLEDKPIIEAAGGGDCQLKNMSFINPLRLTKKSFMTEIPELAPEAYARRNLNKSTTFTGESSEKSTSFSKFSSSSSTLNRVKRDRSMIIRAESLTDKDGKKKDIVHMDCNKNTAKCIEIKCSIYNMQKKAEAFIHIKARLWNSTLVSDYPKVDLVKISSYAKISIPPGYGVQQNEKDDSVSVETLAYPELLDKTADGSVPLWVIIIAVVGGLLVLAFIIFGLWKCGFFKRRRPDPTLSGNLEKNSESKPFISK